MTILMELNVYFFTKNTTAESHYIIDVKLGDTELYLLLRIGMRFVSICIESLTIAAI